MAENNIGRGGAATRSSNFSSWTKLTDKNYVDSNFLNINNGGYIHKPIAIKRVDDYPNGQLFLDHTNEVAYIVYYDDALNSNDRTFIQLTGPKIADNAWMLQLFRVTASGTENYAVLHTGNIQSFGYISGEQIWNTYIPREQLNTGHFGFWNLANTPNLGFKQAVEGCLTVYGTQENGAYITLHKPGVFACHLGLGENTTDLCIGGWSMGENQYLIRHRGNEILTTSDPGAGSQLNTDYIMYVYE